MAEPSQSLRYIIAGMLSTIDFKPSEHHPEHMLDMADKVIHHFRLLDSETVGTGVPNLPSRPFEGQDAR